jgi:hypothetical protein
VFSARGICFWVEKSRFLTAFGMTAAHKYGNEKYGNELRGTADAKRANRGLRQPDRQCSLDANATTSRNVLIK